MKEKIKNNKYVIILLIILLPIIFIITSKVVMNKELIIDKIAYNIILEKLRTPTLTSFMKCVTKLGNTSTMIIFSLLSGVLIFIKEKKKILATTVPSSLLLITIINQILKSIFKRPRPLGYRLIEITGYSFPSGHSVASMAFYGFLIYIIFNLVKNKILRNILITLNVLIIFLIGISRVYLGVHYLSDVITGYSISLIYIIILTKVLKNLKIFP